MRLWSAPVAAARFAAARSKQAMIGEPENIAGELVRIVEVKRSTIAGGSSADWAIQLV